MVDFCHLIARVPNRKTVQFRHLSSTYSNNNKSNIRVMFEISHKTVFYVRFCFLIIFYSYKIFVEIKPLKKKQQINNPSAIITDFDSENILKPFKHRCRYHKKSGNSLQINKFWAYTNHFKPILVFEIHFIHNSKQWAKKSDLYFTLRRNQRRFWVNQLFTLSDFSLMLLWLHFVKITLNNLILLSVPGIPFEWLTLI